MLARSQPFYAMSVLDYKVETKADLLISHRRTVRRLLSLNHDVRSQFHSVRRVVIVNGT